MSIKDRFKMIMDREKLTAGAFAESIGVAQATISHILGPRNKYPSTEVILRLHQRYNDINLEWLLTGQGEMSNTSSDSDPSIESGFDYPLFAENSVNPSNETGSAENRNFGHSFDFGKIPAELLAETLCNLWSTSKKDLIPMYSKYQ